MRRENKGEPAENPMRGTFAAAQRPSGHGGRARKPRDDLPPPCMSGKEHSEG